MAELSQKEIESPESTIKGTISSNRSSDDLLSDELLWQERFEKTRKIKEEIQQSIQTINKHKSEQGFIGKSLDSIKYYAGSSANSPKANWLTKLWSNVLDFDSSSEAIKKNIESYNLLAAETEKSISEKDENKYLQNAKNAQEYYAQINSQNFQKYDLSQKNGVDTITDMAALIASGLVTRRLHNSESINLAKLTLAGGLSGAATKAMLSELDGKYADITKDSLQGFLFGASLPISEMFGAKLSANFASKNSLEFIGNKFTGKIETIGQPTFTNLRSNMLRYGSTGALLNGITTPGRSILDDYENNRNTNFAELTKDTVYALGSGFILGTGLGLVADNLVNKLKFSRIFKDSEIPSTNGEINAAKTRLEKLATSNKPNNTAETNWKAPEFQGLNRDHMLGEQAVFLREQLSKDLSQGLARQELDRRIAQTGKQMLDKLEQLYKLPRHYTVNPLENLESFAQRVIEARLPITKELVKSMPEAVQKEIKQLKALNPILEKEATTLSGLQLRVYSPDRLKQLSTELQFGARPFLGDYLKANGIPKDLVEDALAIQKRLNTEAAEALKAGKKPEKIPLLGDIIVDQAKLKSLPKNIVDSYDGIRNTSFKEQQNLGSDLKLVQEKFFKGISQLPQIGINESSALASYFLPKTKLENNSK